MERKWFYWTSKSKRKWVFPVEASVTPWLDNKLQLCLPVAPFTSRFVWLSERKSHRVARKTYKHPLCIDLPAICGNEHMHRNRLKRWVKGTTTVANELGVPACLGRSEWARLGSEGDFQSRHVKKRSQDPASWPLCSWDCTGDEGWNQPLQVVLFSPDQGKSVWMSSPCLKDPGP